MMGDRAGRFVRSPNGSCPMASSASCTSSRSAYAVRQHEEAQIGAALDPSERQSSQVG